MTTTKQVKAAFREIGKGAQVLLGAMALFALANPSIVQAEPTATEILQGVRLNQSSQHRVLQGQLRTENVRIPFRLILNGPEIRYEFSNPKQIIVLRMGEQGSRLDEITNEGSEKVTAARFDDLIRNSDISYEDLALRFLYWKNARIVGEENVGGFRCYKIELHPDRGSGSQYGTVWAWIGKNSGALAKAECYTPKGVLAVRFKVVSGRKLEDGTWIFKQISIARMRDGKDRDSSPTYIEITGEAKPR